MKCDSYQPMEARLAGVPVFADVKASPRAAGSLTVLKRRPIVCADIDCGVSLSKSIYARSWQQAVC